MKKTGKSTVAVRILHPSMVFREREAAFDGSDVPPRSRLYGLAPCQIGTIWGESLTSYLNRLGWRHGVSPRWLVAQEVVPHLSSDHRPPRLPTFYQQAMSLNGNGELAQTWSTLLERLTGRSDLHLLTLHWWIGDLSSRGHLLVRPAWCPACYSEWREKSLPIYLPLLWQYQVVTICPQHKRRLEEQCPHCHKPQLIIATNQFQPGVCTQCGAWLGVESSAQPKAVSDDEAIWQQWVIHALEELYRTSIEVSPPQWELFFTGLATCLQERGAHSRLERLTGIRRSLFYRWPSKPHSLTLSHPYVPSLETILEFCYACDVTPLQIMTNQLTPLRDFIQRDTVSRSVRPRRPAYARINDQKCLELIQAVLDGKEEPLSIRQLALRLGCGERALNTHFPQECTLISKLAQNHRRQQQEQRLVQICDQIRQTVITLHAQGIFPSHRRLRMIFPPGIMRMPEANVAWHAALRELGLEQ